MKDTLPSESRSGDHDTFTVLDLLTAASNDQNDPDVPLAQILPYLEEAASDDAFFAALARLVRDADNDPA